MVEVLTPASTSVSAQKLFKKKCREMVCFLAHILQKMNRKRRQVGKCITLYYYVNWSKMYADLLMVTDTATDTRVWNPSLTDGSIIIIMWVHFEFRIQFRFSSLGTYIACLLESVTLIGAFLLNIGFVPWNIMLLAWEKPFTFACHPGTNTYAEQTRLMNTDQRVKCKCTFISELGVWWLW